MQSTLSFCFSFIKSLDMAPKVGRKFKTKANRNIASSSSACPLVDRVRFLCDKTEEVYETLTKYRSIQGEREIVLDELDPSIRRNLVSRNWVSLCDVSDPPIAALIREFYSNLSIYSKVTGGHYLTYWIRGKEFRITKKTNKYFHLLHPLILDSCLW